MPFLVEFLRKLDIPHNVITGMEGFLNICKLITMICHINKLKRESHMIISTHTEKALTKLSTYL